MRLLVEKVSAEDASIGPGIAYAVDDDVLVGRDTSCDLVVPSPDVSRRHFRITIRPDGYWLDNLSSRGTWINQEPVDAGRLLHNGDFIQLGGVLLRVVEAAAQTRSAPGVLSIDGLSDVGTSRAVDGSPRKGITAPPLLAFDTNAQTLSLAGHNVVLQPMSLQAMEVLLREAGRWVSFDVLMESLWPDSVTGTPGYVSKYISYVRQAMAEILEDDEAARQQLYRSLVQHADGYSDVGDLSATDVRSLLREFIKARRRVGFRVLIGEENVQLL